MKRPRISGRLSHVHCEESYSPTCIAFDLEVVAHRKITSNSRLDTLIRSYVGVAAALTNDGDREIQGASLGRLATNRHMFTEAESSGQWQAKISNIPDFEVTTIQAHIRKIVLILLFPTLCKISPSDYPIRHSPVRLTTLLTGTKLSPMSGAHSRSIGNPLRPSEPMIQPS